MAGIDISLTGTGLDPFQQYNVTIYAFDTGSITPTDGTGARTADYTANGQFLLTTTFVNRSSADFPTSNDQYAFSGTATADEFGSLLLSGRRISGQNPNLSQAPGVFINALVVTPVPEPSSALLAASGVVALLAGRRRRR